MMYVRELSIFMYSIYPIR